MKKLNIFFIPLENRDRISRYTKNIYHKEYDKIQRNKSELALEKLMYLLYIKSNR